MYPHEGKSRIKRGKNRFICARKQAGQINLIDTVLAIFVYAVIVSFIMSFWWQSMQGADNTVKKNKMQYLALSASSLLMKGTGASQGGSSSFSGLASSQYELSESLIAAFCAQNYSSQKSLLGSPYGFFLSIDANDGSRLYECGNSSAQTANSVAVSRFAMLGNQKVVLRLVLYG